MYLYLGADHRGLSLKHQVIDWLQKQSIEFTDFGAYEMLPEDDYNDYAKKVVNALLDADTQPVFGVLICGSAQGMCMQANRFKGIRAAICRNPQEAQETRSHNNANVLCLPADTLNTDQAIATLQTFLRQSPLEQPKYLRRNQKLDEDI